MDSLSPVSTSTDFFAFGHSYDIQFTSLADLLSHHYLKVMDCSSEYTLSIDRSTKDVFWHGVVSFYKGALSKPQKLTSNLVINFTSTGEVGCDAGALRREFFEDALHEVSCRLFEGDNQARLIPKKDIGLELMFEVAGMIVAHSVLLSGPGLPCLSPTVFDYLSHGDVRHCYPTKDDVPLNLSTHELHTLIDEVCV